MFTSVGMRRVWCVTGHVEIRLADTLTQSFPSCHHIETMYHVTLVQRLTNPDDGAGIRFRNWLLKSMVDGVLFLVVKHGSV
jgi:hypothetical protein